MRLFKFFSAALFYAVYGKDENEAREYLFDYVGQMTIDKVEEIPESEWDEKSISVWEDNDFSKVAYKASVRETLIGDTAQLVYSNDMSLF